MKVICINNKPMAGDVKNQPVLEEGQPYNVTNEVTGFTFEGWEGPCYQLEGFPPIYAFQKERFIPLSNKDETEYADEVLEKMFVPIKHKI